MPPLHNELADKVRESISVAIRLVREIFAEERLAETETNSLSRRAPMTTILESSDAGMASSTFSKVLRRPHGSTVRKNVEMGI
jgi:hypothetical protein